VAKSGDGGAGLFNRLVWLATRTRYPYPLPATPCFFAGFCGHIQGKQDHNAPENRAIVGIKTTIWAIDEKAVSNVEIFSLHPQTFYISIPTKGPKPLHRRLVAF
tara:strand:+ start:902 stop:1213 length:312 start_codon:yes stop_codon:yes gene_type:complete